MKIKPNIRSFYTLTTPIKWEAVNVVKEYTKCVHTSSLFGNNDSVYDTKKGKVRTVKYYYHSSSSYYKFNPKDIKNINELFAEKFKDTRWKVEISTLYSSTNVSTKIKIIRKNEDTTQNII